MGQDARVRYTQMMIKRAFVELLRHQPVSRITVKEICGLSQINRATFYNHYKDPLDLLEHMEQELIDELQQYMSAAQPRGVHKVLVSMMDKISSDSDLYITLTSENGDNTLPIRIFSICYQYISEDIRQRFPRMTDTEKEWLYIYMAQGCSGILSCWVRNGMKELPEEVSAFMENLLENTIRQPDAMKQII